MTLRFLDYGIRSEIPLPLTDSDWAPENWINIRVLSLCASENAERHEWQGDYHPDMYCERFYEGSDEMFDLVFVDYLRARITNAMTSKIEILVDVQSEDQAAVGHLLVDQVIPRMLGQCGHLMLHAGAVANEQGALVFLGETGSGKSTLCASFNCDGWQILSDDCVRIDVPNNTVIGTYAGVRLYADSLQSTLGDRESAAPMADYSQKLRLQAQPVAFGEVPVTGMILLDSEASDFYLEALCGSASALFVLNESFSLWPGDAQLASDKLQLVSDFLKSGVPVYRCGWPHDYDNLPSAKRQLLARLSSL